MQDDFFVELGEALSQAAKDFGAKADSFLEVQKLRTKIASEKKMVSQDREEIGLLIYKRYLAGEVFSDDLMELCADIARRKSTIAEYRESISRIKGEDEEDE